MNERWEKPADFPSPEEVISLSQGPLERGYSEISIGLVGTMLLADAFQTHLWLQVCGIGGSFPDQLKDNIYMIRFLFPKEIKGK